MSLLESITTGLNKTASGIAGFRNAVSTVIGSINPPAPTTQSVFTSGVFGFGGTPTPAPTTTLGLGDITNALISRIVDKINPQDQPAPLPAPQAASAIPFIFGGGGGGGVTGTQVLFLLMIGVAFIFMQKGTILKG